MIIPLDFLPLAIFGRLKRLPSALQNPRHLPMSPPTTAKMATVQRERAGYEFAGKMGHLFTSLRKEWIAYNLYGFACIGGLMGAVRNFDSIISADSHVYEPSDLWWKTLGINLVKGRREPLLTIRAERERISTAAIKDYQ